MKYLRLIIFLLLPVLGACSKQLNRQPAPDTRVDLSGTWRFVKQNEQSIRRMQHQLNYVPVNIDGKTSMVEQNATHSKYDTNQHKLLRNLLVGLLTTSPRELYFEFTGNSVAIDFGVAGYHTFSIQQESEIFIDGFEVDAFANWKNNTLVIQMNMGSSYEVIENFMLLDDSRLLETIELKIPNRKRPVIHKRLFKRQ